MNATPLPPAVLDYRQASAYLGISPGRLRNLMWLGIGPKKISYGKRDVRFRVADLNAFIDSKIEKANPDPAPTRPRGRPRKDATYFTVHTDAERQQTTANMMAITKADITERLRTFFIILAILAVSLPTIAHLFGW